MNIILLSEVFGQVHKGTSMAGAATQAGARGIGHSQGHRLQLEAMEGTDSLHRRRGTAGGQQLGRKPDPSDCNGLLIGLLFFKCLKTLRSAYRCRRDTGDLFARSRREPADLPKRQRGSGTAHAELPALRARVPA